jgi:hypothetical protein
MSDTNSDTNSPTWEGIETCIDKIDTRDSPTALKLTKLDETNWSSWRDQMKHAMVHYRLQPYLDGSLPCPVNNPVYIDNWQHNDNFAQMLIIFNIEAKQNIHISQCASANTMWNNLEAIHESKGNQTAMAIMHNMKPA